MTVKYKVEKIFIPFENSSVGSVPIKIIQLETGRVFVGIGEDDWVIKNGIALDDINKLRLGV